MKEKQIPTILGIFLVLGLLGSFFAFQKGKTVLESQANESIEPCEVKITNNTDNLFVVSWVTKKETTGVIELVTEVGSRLYKDSRNKNGGLDSFVTHYVEVDGLEASKDYNFLIFSGGKKFLNNGVYYKAETAVPVSGELPKANLASGTVGFTGGAAADGAIVYISIEGINPLSSLVTSQGNWAIALSNAFSRDLSGMSSYQEGQILEEIFIQGGEKGTASAIIYTSDDDPVPPIVLGNQYDFIKNKQVVADVSAPTPTIISKLEGLGEGNAVGKAFTVENPEDGEVVNFLRPEFFGTGANGASVKVTVESPTKYEGSVVINNDGNWRWVPPSDLSPGAHTLTATYKDQQTGEEKTIIRSFVLAATTDTEEPSFTATPSGSLITPTLTPIPTIAELILTSAPTPTQALMPTIEERTTLPSTESGVPTSGFWEPMALIAVGGFILFLISAAIF